MSNVQMARNKNYQVVLFDGLEEPKEPIIIPVAQRSVIRE
jgi:hypothetical protein